MNCIICGSLFPAFLDHGTPPRPGRCPACGARGRHRTLALLARQRLLPRLGPGTEVLEIGPSRYLVERLARLWTGEGARYTAVDLKPLNPGARMPPSSRFLAMDGRWLDFPAASFDLVVCNNVLSYIREDGAVLAGMRRVMRPEGLAIATVHLVNGPTLTAEEYGRLHPSECTPEFLRDNGTEWYYGDDYGYRLAAAGFPAWTDAAPASGLDEDAAAEQGLSRTRRLRLAAGAGSVLESWTGRKPWTNA